ncbi:hypothetical protein CVV68_11990, partial [Arthrobacter livingstonensis]
MSGVAAPEWLEQGSGDGAATAADPSTQDVARTPGPARNGPKPAVAPTAATPSARDVRGTPAPSRTGPKPAKAVDSKAVAAGVGVDSLADVSVAAGVGAASVSSAPGCAVLAGTAALLL